MPDKDSLIFMVESLTNSSLGADANGAVEDN